MVYAGYSMSIYKDNEKQNDVDEDEDDGKLTQFLYLK